MTDLNIEKTNFSPSIITDIKSGLINIEGKSYPENTLEFYAPLEYLLESFFKELPSKKLIFNIEIIYFNSSSSKHFFEIFDLINDNKDKCSVEVNWIYDKDDESSFEVGEEFKEDFEDLNMNLVQKQ